MVRSQQIAENDIPASSKWQIGNGKSPVLSCRRTRLGIQHCVRLGIQHCVRLGIQHCVRFELGILASETSSVSLVYLVTYFLVLLAFIHNIHVTTPQDYVYKGWLGWVSDVILASINSVYQAQHHKTMLIKNG
jgi:hypothetical protein